MCTQSAPHSTTHIATHSVAQRFYCFCVHPTSKAYLMNSILISFMETMRCVVWDRLCAAQCGAQIASFCPYSVRRTVRRITSVDLLLPLQLLLLPLFLILLVLLLLLFQTLSGIPTPMPTSTTTTSIISAINTIANTLY